MNLAVSSVTDCSVVINVFSDAAATDVRPWVEIASEVSKETEDFDQVAVGDDINVNPAGSEDEVCDVALVRSATKVAGVRIEVSDMLPATDCETPAVAVPCIVWPDLFTVVVAPGFVVIVEAEEVSKFAFVDVVSELVVDSEFIWDKELPIGDSVACGVDVSAIWATMVDSSDVTVSLTRSE